MLRDGYDRCIEVLRISVTDRCNLRCVYCMPAEGVPRLDHAGVLRYEEIVAVTRVLTRRGLHAVRLTGGEPLARRGIGELVRTLAGLVGLDDIALTTNATLLVPRLAAELASAGLRRVNVGLPSLDPDTYRALTRGGDLAAALAGIDTALAAGFAPVKINVVLLRGVNDDPAPFLELTRRLPVEVRFIEYMPIGAASSDRYLLPMAEFARRLEVFGPFAEVATLAGKGPSRGGMQLPGAPGRIASISAMSQHFCSRCNRLRLTADGHLRPCLFDRDEVDLKPALRPMIDEVRLDALLNCALAAKPEAMPEGPVDYGRRMSQIGG